MAAKNDTGLAERFRAGDIRALARAISLVERRDASVRALEESLRGKGSDTKVVGFTGAPGTGKSTLVDALVALLRKRGKPVAVIATDPNSPFTGGAILGDRIRMSEHVHDPGVFIRSMAARRALGGLALAARLAIRALMAFGFDWVLVETVGVGQAEVDIMGQADTTLVVLAPGWGDDVQASKAGVLEIADVFVVNKADRPGVDITIRELRVYRGP